MSDIVTNSCTSNASPLRSLSKTDVVMDYYNKKIMAPMVRIGTLPMRLLALENGCDIAYSEELIDFKVKNTTRVVNEKLNTVDFISKDKSLTYRTCDADVRNVLQLGTASSVTALEAANVVVNDVCAIDINMGCPKFFSVQGGMGSALLSQPEKIKDILSTLIRNLPIPVTCKIRLLATDNETIDLLKIIENTGVKAIAVHARMIPERPRDPAHWDRLENILSNASFSVPIIVNGDIFEHGDIASSLAKTKANSVMIARGAIRNASIFSQPVATNVHKLIQRYIQIAYENDNHAVNTKYNITNILNENLMTQTPEFKSIQSAKDYPAFCNIFNISSQYEKFVQSQKVEAKNYISVSVQNEDLVAKDNENSCSNKNSNNNNNDENSSNNNNNKHELPGNSILNEDSDNNPQALKKQKV
ncbi:hypothetical protein CYY_002481 [Polysphondylium violaceum]|uniref:DUS-like FMN-binding domain-containing protein n=1 Tax=Polysphondylium violaceum TaxID=133409 RepID=A0A8J4PYY3_9MYCE|nr:hypothetical protein CYY_002481 [Polysphondylium violaceum]